MLLALIKIAILIGGLMTGAAYLVLLERWMAAWVQDRRGPNRVGPFGFLQPAADGVKMMLKESYTPSHVNKWLFLLAPIAILTSALAIFAGIPFGSTLPESFSDRIAQNESLPSWVRQIGVEERPIELIVAPELNVGIIYVFALSSVAVYGVILGGWASNNKYSFLGGLRSSAQLIAYEIPLGLGLLGVVMAAGSLNLPEIIHYQADHLWFALAQPLGLIVFVTAAFAEAARLPFDLPEAEQELIGGYHTEYGGMKLLLFLVAEFLHMITAAYLIVILFFGGWHGPFVGDGTAVTWTQAILAIVWLHLKVFLVILFFMLVRWSWPRFRFDQLMALAWKVMLPLGTVHVIAVLILEEVRRHYPQEQRTADWLMALVSWVICIAALVLVGWKGPLIADNRPAPARRSYEIDAQI